MPVSVIIPIAPGDTAWLELLPQLELPTNSEIILCPGMQDFPDRGHGVQENIQIKICREGSGRAGQMNAGARTAANEMLWFLHADSRINSDTLAILDDAISCKTQGLFFFDLKFLEDGPEAMKWNEWAVRWRAGWMKIPFGDQGFLMARTLFFKLGGYREDLKYGEDHVLVWKIRQEGYPVVHLPAAIYTSARKYKEGGWLSVTALHVWLTVVQAVPNWLELKRRQLLRVFR